MDGSLPNCSIDYSEETGEWVCYGEVLDKESNQRLKVKLTSTDKNELITSLVKLGLLPNINL